MYTSILDVAGFGLTTTGGPMITVGFVVAASPVDTAGITLKEA